MWFCVRPERAAESFEALRQVKAHTLTPAYLAVRRALLVDSTKRKPTITLTVKGLLDDYFVFEGAPDGYPWARPFTHRGGNDVLNKNPAGSFAWSNRSQREVMIRFLDHLEDQDPDYALKPNHWELAREALLKQERLPTDALIAFLYRDFAFEADEPSFDPLIDRFAQEFDFRAEGGGLTSQFRHLFIEVPDDVDPDNWFEPYELGGNADAATATPPSAEDE